MKPQVKAITAKGIVHGKEVTFEAIRDRDGYYALGKVIGRKAGTRPNDVVNKVQVETLDRAAELLVDNVGGKPRYYIWLVYDDGNGTRRRNQYAPKSVEITWH